jgi:outer membrane receptor for monomeric catechols
VAEFNRRATEGSGRYLTRDYIEKRAAANVMDLLRSVPGVRIRCGRTDRVCTLHFARHAGCSPAYFLDGIPTDKSVLYLMSPNDLEGIELYSGPSETPPEMEGARSMCGAVAMWTRVGEKP